MSAKNTPAARTTVTRDIAQLDQETGNIYEAVYMLGRRADQITVQIKDERMPKSTALAVQELLDGKLYWRRRDAEEKPAETVRP